MTRSSGRREVQCQALAGCSQGMFLGQELVELGFGGLVRHCLRLLKRQKCRCAGWLRGHQGFSCPGDGRRVQDLFELSGTFL